MIELPRVRPFVGKAIQPILVDARVEAPGGYGFPSPTGNVSGGGWWQWTTKGMQSYRPEHVKMLRAFAMMVAGGERVRVPVIDDPQRLAPLPGPTPFGDGSSFSDGSLFAGGSVDAVLLDDVGLRDDEAVIWVRSGQALTGGELWSIERAYEKGPELHLNGMVEDLGADRWKVRLGPTLRQAHQAGAEINFNRPAFAATIPDTSTLWPEYGVEWVGEASVTFVEAP